ncbi:MAG TPA: winged helix DNA-binding domain-containing protein, partial [Micromonosporaceae bacterium]|nr:winged helix DNA-binding domain-containing protein [Micromonosporaceae bacterium]
GQRTRGYDDTAIQRAIDDGAILRTHALRPTWHFVAAADIAWIQALTGPRVHALNAYYNRRHGLDGELVGKTNKVLTGALRGGNHLTRKELAEVLGKVGVDATGNRLAYVVMRAELDGLIANGVMRGKQHTYALVSERAPDAQTLPPDEALAELTRRYFTSHGPATVKDFSWWSSLTVAQIKRGLDLVGSRLSSQEVDGHTYWYAPATAPKRDRPPTVHVLQGYDEYVVAYTESRSVTNLAGLPAGTPNENQLIHPIVLDSQVVGFWRRGAERGGITARPTLAVARSAQQRRAVDAAFARYAEFAGVPVTVEW